jgi:BASS family bile acid:Na+ symporter
VVICTNDLILALIQTGSMVSTFAYMFSRGVETRRGDLWYLGARPGMMVKSLFTVDILVPLIALAVIVLVRPPKATAFGLLLLAASPVAPMVLNMILKAGGSREYALGFHFVLALLAMVTTPITIELLAGLAGFHLEVSPDAVAEVVGLSILLPITAGIITGRLLPAAKRISQPLGTFSGVVSMLLNILVFVYTYQLLLTLDIRSFLAIALMVLGALVAGHLMARGQAGEQVTLALESATGNVGLALLIASTFTTLEKALPVIIPYVVISAIICSIYVRYSKKETGCY